MFVFAMENSSFKGGLKLSNGRFGNVMGDVLTVFGPKMMAKF